MKILIGILASFILYFLVRPLATIGYIISYRQLPNFKAYWKYSERSSLRDMEKYYVYDNFMSYIRETAPLEFYGVESKEYRYFPNRKVSN
jgi:hypothetical protein